MAMFSRVLVVVGMMTTIGLECIYAKGSDAIAIKEESSIESMGLVNDFNNDINNRHLIRRLTWWYRYYGDSSDSGSGSNSGSGSGSKSGSKSDSGRFRGSSSGSKSGSDSGRGSKSDSKSVSKSDSKRGSASNSGSKSDSDSGSKSGSKSDSKSFSKSVSDSRSGSKSLSKSDSKDDDNNKDNGEKYWIRLNCGADGNRDEDGSYSYFDPYGLYWISDYGYSNSDSIECCGDYNYYDKEIYKSGTFKSGDDDLVYTFNNIPNGIYFIRLRFAEIFFDSPGDRRFGIIVNGDHKEESVDIVDWVGKNEPLDLEYYQIEVRYNYMEIRFTKIANDPKCSGIEVYQVDYPYW